MIENANSRFRFRERFQVILAGAAAYGAAKNDTVKGAGAAAAKVYNKAADIEQEYEAHRTTTLANFGQMLPESLGQSPFF